jgi:hypothetical protein
MATTREGDKQKPPGRVSSLSFPRGCREESRVFARSFSGAVSAALYAAAVCLYLAHHNLMRMHMRKTLRMAPAQAHGVVDHLWTIERIGRAIKFKLEG